MVTEWMGRLGGLHAGLGGLYHIIIGMFEEA